MYSTKNLLFRVSSMLIHDILTLCSAYISSTMRMWHFLNLNSLHRTQHMGWWCPKQGDSRSFNNLPIYFIRFHITYHDGKESLCI